MALPVVGGAFLSSFLNVLLDRLASRQVLDFIRGKNVTEGLLKKLKIKLLSVNALVDDAEKKQIRSPTVKQCLDELRDVLCAAGDLLDEINTEALRRKLEGECGNSNSSSTSQVQNYNSTLVDECDKTLEPRIMEILDALQLIVEESHVLGLREGVEDRPQVSIRESTSLVDESDVYGRNEDKEAIIELLLSDDASEEKIGVIPIVGMGGIGKTTLAQLVYNEHRVKEHFELQAWVCVSEESDIRTITPKIYGSFTSQVCGIPELDSLQIELKKALTEKKFLLVLDDVWKANYIDWDVVRRPLEYGAHGSKIIVTTRNTDIASIMRTLPPHHLMQICEEDCWSLFAKHAFKNAQVRDANPNLAVIGREIVRKCDGLPLAAKSLGALLRYEIKTEQWRNVLESDIWDLLDKEKIIIPALWLSYYYLPSHLKRCFAYSSIFPKDYKFKKSELVLQWMAEDLIQPEKKKTLEEVGAAYFDNLVSRSFFQLQSKSTIFKEAFFTMHDLINDLATFVSGEFCCRLEGGDSSSVARKTRHLSYMTRNHYGLERFEALLYQAKYLHTFLPLSQFGNHLYWDRKVLNGLISSLQCLRFLNLSGYQSRELPDSICSLRHLRHLDLSFSEIEKLSETVCSLYNLQTLLLFKCGALVELPTNLGKLINLRRLEIGGTSLKMMPPDMGNLKDLQTLSKFVLDEHTGHNIVELKKLQHLRKTLRISGLVNIVHAGDDLEANILSDKKHLEDLVLTWGGDNYADQNPEKDGEVLHKLQPHTNLKTVEIDSYGGIKFPLWLGDPSFSNLSSIELRNCKHCCVLPSLGQLPCLRVLDIHGLNNLVEIGSEFYGKNGTCGTFKPFRCLEELTFENMSEWREWSYYVGGGNVEEEKEGGMFPSLRFLTLRNCPKVTEILPLDNFLKLEDLSLESLESFSGLLSHMGSKCPKFPSLSYLEMERCPNVSCFPEGGMDAPKLRDMIVSKCEKLRSLPEQMHTLLPSLEDLKITDCPQLESFPEGGLPSKLERLEILRSGIRFANRALWGLQRLTSLRRLTLYFANECETIYSFPEEGQLPPTTLTHLEISHLPNLTTIQGNELRQQLISLEEFSIWNCPELQCFQGEAPNSLRELLISGCPKLQCLPAEWLPASLSQLTFWQCPTLLEQRFQRDKGEDWPNIAHIPSIDINYRRI